jgi:hypothetical protein
LLPQIDNFFQHFLFDFQEPHKIDLEAFMNNNYKYNVTLSTFAKLTGRSLSTSKEISQKYLIHRPKSGCTKTFAASALSYFTAKTASVRSIS